MKTICLYGVDSCIRRRCYRIDRLQKDAVQGKVMVALLLFSQAVEIGAPQAPSVSRAGRQSKFKFLGKKHEPKIEKISFSQPKLETSRSLICAPT